MLVLRHEFDDLTLSAFHDTVPFCYVWIEQPIDRETSLLRDREFEGKRICRVVWISMTYVSLKTLISGLNFHFRAMHNKCSGLRATERLLLSGHLSTVVIWRASRRTGIIGMPQLETFCRFGYCGRKRRLGMVWEVGERIFTSCYSSTRP